jgi:molybdate/tungstate transport system ATP-binding protein
MKLEVSGLRTAYGEFTFGPVDLSVGREVLAVLGPSGSGKTTLLSLIAGIASPDAGSIRLAGRELVGQPLEARRVGLVFQEGALFPHMTARENVAYAATDEARVGALTSLLELDGVLDRRPPKLSGGERQRVALARTLAADPDALLLDEPLSSLDAPIRRRLREELHDLFASLDVPILYVTHDQRTATALGDRVAIVNDGRVEQVESPSTLLDRPATRFVAQFTGNENLFDGRVVGRTDERVRVRAGDVTVRTTPPTGIGRDVTICIHPSRVELNAPDVVDDVDGQTVLEGTVTDWLNEGTEYRVDVQCGGLTLTASVRPPEFDRLPIERGSAVSVSLPDPSVHLLPRPGSGTPVG